MAPRKARASHPKSPPVGVTSDTKLPPKVENRSSEARNHGYSLTEARIERAKRALESARRFESGLTAVASRMAGKDIKVDFDPKIHAPYTDGKVIKLRPSLNFADHVKHVPTLCDLRDAVTDKMLCPACARFDAMFATFQHEVAHIVHGSFDGLTEDEKRLTLARVIGERGGHRASKVAKLLESAEHMTFIQAANLVSPYLGMLVNCMEDARVNRAAMGALPGLRRSFRADVLEVMRDGIEDPTTGEHHPWGERELDSQALIGALLVAFGIPEGLEHLDPEVAKLYSDPRLKAQVDAINLASSASDAFEVAWTTLESLRAKGFCRRKDDPEDEPEPARPQGENDIKPPPMSESNAVEDDDEGDDEEQPEGQPMASEDSDNESDDDKDGAGSGPKHDDDESDDSDEESDDEDGQAAGSSESDDDEESDDEAAGSGGDDDKSDDDKSDDGAGEPGGDKSDDDADEQLMLERLKDDLQVLMGHPERNFDESERLDLEYVDNQLEVMDAPSLNVATVNIHQFDTVKGEQAGVWRESIWTDRYEDLCDLAAVNRTVMQARMVFAENRAVHMTGGLRVGRINPKAMTRIKMGDDKVFRRRQRSDDRDYFAVVGLDISGSTKGYVLRMIRKIGWGMGEVFARTGVDFSMYCHTGFSGPHGMSVDLFEVKGANEPWNRRVQERLRLINSAAFNLDGHTLEQYRKLAERSNATDRIIFYLTDGEMPAANEEEETVVLKREIAKCEKLGIKLIGIGLGTDSPKQHGLDTIRVDRTEELPRLIKDVGNRLL